MNEPPFDRQEAYRLLLLIRRFEERLLALFREGALRGTAHVCIGQEAVAVGACLALRVADTVTSNHRGHGHLLARGGDPTRIMAEMFGHAGGYARGRGGSQHMAALEIGFLGSNGITAGGLPVAAGAALSQKLRQTGGVCLAFFGDGAAAQGAFHEALNLAAVQRLPAIFLCENNRYAMGTPTEAHCPTPRLADRALGYGIPGVTVDGNDVAAVHGAVTNARARAITGGGPSLIEATTFRLSGHSRSDLCSYLPDGAVEAWRDADPLPRWRARIEPTVGAEALDRIDAEVESRIDAAVAEARAQSPLAPAEALDGLYPASLPEATAQGRGDGDAKPMAADLGDLPLHGETRYVEALRMALDAELAADPSVLLLGEDIGAYGGAFKVTDGLQAKYGPDRVRDMPISENTIVGAAVGAALTGLRPVAEIMFFDFITLALDQLANHAAKFPYLYGAPLPLVVRTPAGGRRGYGATHSQCFESLLLSIPGLRIYCPATVRDAYDLLRAAIRDPGPVVVVEHKLLYGRKATLGEGGMPPLPPGRARVVRAGRDLTLVTYSHMVGVALQAAEALARKGVEAEVLDLRTLNPLDMETVAASANRTGRVLIAEEGARTGGVGAEIAARAQEACFGYLDAPILRVAARDCPIPTCESLERAILPQAEDILRAAKQLLEQ